ncbi:MAG TPA: S41 family peptidase [Chitinophagaceae bacterium]
MRYMKAKLMSVSALLILASSCKKNHDSGGGGGTTTTPPTEEELVMDSVYKFSKEVYFWNSVIPDSAQFNARQYKGSDELTSASNVMDAIRKLQPLDRFSFVTTLEQSNGIQTGQDKDYGFFLKAGSLDQVQPYDSVYWFVTYVYDQSTAGLAGVKRGWIINKINGTQLGYDQASVDILNNTFFGTTNSANFEFLKPDGTTSSASLSKSSFQANSVLYKNVITNGPNKIGYLVFNQFFDAPSRAELGTAFDYFTSQGITDLVVDLRYNPGGSTETQDTLADLIAPAAANNQKMYTYQFNTQLQQGNFPLLKTKPGFSNVSFAEDINSVNFAKAGSLNLSRVFFIVTNGTASASELLMNNLKPYMTVKLIGDTTYGKPVGFFPIELASKYAMYPISFRTINSAGNADYYTGFAPDNLAPDGVNKDWGDVTEPSLASAIKFITTGSFRLAGADRSLENQRQVQQSLKPLQRKIESNKFVGMYKPIK